MTSTYLAEPAKVLAAQGIAQYAWLLVALPLLGAAILLIGGRRPRPRRARTHR